MPYGNGKARAKAFGICPIAMPVHREPIYTPRPDLVAKYPTLPNARQFRMPNLGFDGPEGGGRQGHRQAVPDHPDLRPSRRIRRRRRGDPLQQVARRAAAGHVHRDQSGGRRRARHQGRRLGLGDRRRNTTRRRAMKALVTERVGKGVALMPFHFAGWFQGVDQRSKYPKGADPIVLGESVNTHHHLRLRPGDRHAGSQSHPLPDPSGVRRTTMARMKFLCDADRCIECNACVTACKNEHEVPWGINRRRVVTINDGKPGERSVSMACMHCTDAPCAAVCPVNCFYTTADAVVLHSKDLCIGCGYCFYACPFGAPQYPRVGNFGSRGKMDKCTYLRRRSGSGRHARQNTPNTAPTVLPKASCRSAPRCARPSRCSPATARSSREIYKERVMKRGYGSGVWGWKTAYSDSPTRLMYGRAAAQALRRSRS